ncbi:hypothetical protein AURDEDRAFT_114870 [Auricularia subglabra TFB-10046 SS5]|nr:hypothetical protein AURDEDRAFT_114870 [Auricularia subglabra TFB-10046 SS5]
MEAVSRFWPRASGYTSVLQQDVEKQRPAKPGLKRILLVAFLFVIPVSFLIAYTLEWVWQSRATTPRRRFPYGRVIQLEDVQAREARLPQHNLDLPFPEGRGGRFVRFTNESRTGRVDFATRWSEASVLATLSLLAQRAHVFEPIVLDDGAWPIGLFLAGPAAGGNWGPGVDAPRAISNVFWEQVCPPQRRRVLSVDAVQEELGISSSTGAGAVVDRWADYLGRLQDNCVEVQGSLLDCLSTPDAISLWPTMASSPVITRSAWSTPVMLGVARNLPRILSQHPASLATNTSFMRRFDDLLRPLLVLHVPRPTSEACTAFVGWALLPSLPDRQADASCTATVAQMVTKVDLALEQYAATLSAAQAPPDHVYIASDADDAVVEELKRNLLDDEGGRKWKVVSTSKDLILMGAENDVRQTIEIEIARRAALFVGSGFSTTSSAVVALRLAQGSLPRTIRFF